MVQNVNCKCRFDCNKKFSVENQSRVFHILKVMNGRKIFLCAKITESTPSRIRTTSEKRRVRSKTFCFDKKRLCKYFCKKTFDIGKRVIYTALKGQPSGRFVSFDKRGRHTPHYKTPEALLDKVRQHIESVPIVEAHYTRQDTKRQFLGSDLNITKMYSLYKEKCSSDGVR